jgi:cell division transport system ATP-binding protein
MIDLHNVSVQYDEGHSALRGVSLHVEDGEFVFIIGATGAGKSTLLKLLYREETPTQGRVVVNGCDVAAMRPGDVPRFRRRMGVVFQDFGLLPGLTVFENVAFALRVTGARRRAIRARVPECLETVGLMARCDAFPGQLSGGEQQRVAIARALANHPALLVADEPTGNLDPATSLGIAEVLYRINEAGTTVVVSTHDHTMVDNQPRRVVELAAGEVIRDEAEGTYQSAPRAEA